MIITLNSSSSAFCLGKSLGAAAICSTGVPAVQEVMDSRVPTCALPLVHFHHCHHYQPPILYIFIIVNDIVIIIVEVVVINVIVKSFNSIVRF